MSFDPYAMLIVVLAVLTAAALSHLTAQLIIRHGGQRLLDVPGPRSSHRVATPRGGGIGIVLTLLAAVVAMAFSSVWPMPFWGALGGLAVVAGIGLLDDVQPQPAGLRLAAHLAAALLVVAALVAGRFPPPSWLWLLTAVLALAWSVNLHNFMDGIDGLIGWQAVFCGFAFAALFAIAQEPAMTLFAALLGGAALGFLPLNWPRARVFMGDGGAGAIGMAIGLLALYGSVTGLVPLPVGLTLTSAFLIDSGATLLLRAFRRQRLWLGHREHLYQRLVQCGHGHARVTAGYLAWNLLVALPLAAIAQFWRDGSRAWLLALIAGSLGLLLWLLLRWRCRRALVSTRESG